MVRNEKTKNPFVIEGYVSQDYFCDREKETALLTRHLTNGCNVTLMAPRRLGKSGLVFNCFNQREVRDAYHCIYVDIYETKNLDEFVYELGKSILAELRPKGRKVWENFLNILSSLRSIISFDINGNPEWSVGIGDITLPDVTLDEIFAYLNNADKPCLVAIDEFQTIANYPEKTVEASLRKRIQNCHNASFVFSGSKRHLVAQMFTSPSRPFFNSSAIMGLEPIDRNVYFDFVNRHLSNIGKAISREAFDYVYDTYQGVTWYIQYVMNMLYTSFSPNSVFIKEDVEGVVVDILSQHRFAYQSLMYQLTSKQKQVVMAIAREGKVASLMSQSFLKRYNLGASTVQAAVKTLLDRDFITFDEGEYQLGDLFLAQYLVMNSKG
ncbi:MAG: ATP-binding protein [Prevotella sp.]